MRKFLRIYSGSVQTLGVSGLDGRGGPGFSDDDVSLSPPRHSYVLELGPRHAAYHSACSDDELAFTSSDDIAACEYEHHHHHLHHHHQHTQECQFAGRRPRSSSQGRYGNRYHHYCPDAL